LRALAEARGHALVQLFGRLELAALEVGQPERVGHVVVAGRELKRRFEFQGRAREVAEHEVCLAEHVAGGGALGIAREGAFERGEGALVLPGVEARDGQIDEHLGRVGPARGRPFERGDGRRVVAQGGIGAPEFPVSLGEDGLVLGLGRDEVAGAPQRLGPLVVFAERVGGGLLLLRLPLGRGEREEEDE
jgi:hypothetical protein